MNYNYNETIFYVNRAGRNGKIHGFQVDNKSLIGFWK